MLGGLLLKFLAGVAIGAAAAAVVYTVTKITVSFLKEYRKKVTSELLVANAEALMKNSKHISMDTLDQLSANSSYVAEIDENMEVSHDDIGEETSQKVLDIVKENGGAVIFYS